MKITLCKSSHPMKIKCIIKHKGEIFFYLSFQGIQKEHIQINRWIIPGEIVPYRSFVPICYELSACYQSPGNALFSRPYWKTPEKILLAWWKSLWIQYLISICLAFRWRHHRDRPWIRRHCEGQPITMSQGITTWKNNFNAWIHLFHSVPTLIA
jgi:hypothetical protein